MSALEAFATKIAAIWRGFAVKRKQLVKRASTGATKIAAVWRGFLVRRQHPGESSMPEVFSRNTVRRYDSDAHSSLSQLACSKVSIMREPKDQRKQDDIDIQAARKHIEFRILKRRCAVRIQAAWRGWITRMSITRWKLYHIELRLLEDKCAIQIQAAWRDYDARRLAVEMSDCSKKENKLIRCFLAILGFICYTMLISVCWDLAHMGNDISDQYLQLSNQHSYLDNIDLMDEVFIHARVQVGREAMLSYVPIFHPTIQARIIQERAHDLRCSDLLNGKDEDTPEDTEGIQTATYQQTTNLTKEIPSSIESVKDQKAQGIKAQQFSTCPVRDLVHDFREAFQLLQNVTEDTERTFFNNALVLLLSEMEVMLSVNRDGMC